MNMKQIERNDLLNMWLKYHNKTVDDVIAEQPEEVLKSPEWFKLYPVTQEQHDEWEKEAKEYARKVTKLSKQFIEKVWGFTYLDVAPSVRHETQ